MHCELKDVFSAPHTAFNYVTEKARNSSDVVLDQIRAEHREIQALLCLYAVEPAEQVRDHILMRICRELRLHCAVEAGILIPALAQASSNQRLLEETGTAYAKVTGMINELASGGSSGETLHGQVRALHSFVDEHIGNAESEAGIFRQVQGLNIDWRLLEEKIATRRQELALSLARGDVVRFDA